MYSTHVLRENFNGEVNNKPKAQSLRIFFDKLKIMHHIFSNVKTLFKTLLGNELSQVGPTPCNPSVFH